MSRRDGSAILPVGMVNLKTGEFKYGNIYDFWGEDTTYEVYDIGGGKIRVVATAGSTPIIKVGQRSSFVHDQTGRYLFDGTVIEAVIGNDGLRTLVKHRNSLSIATYK